MKTKPIFKSVEGKNKILANCRRLLSVLTVPYNQRYIETTFGKTYILEAGKSDGPVIMLFHGSCSNSAMWFSDINRLADQYHVFAVDIIGEAGNSEEIRLDLTTDAYANWVKELLDALGIQKVILMGNSFGGWMSLKFATVYPERVSKLVLIATSGITPTKISFLFKSVFFIMLGDRGLKAQNKMIFGTDDIPKGVIEVTDLIVKNFNPMLGALPNYNDDQLIKLVMPVMYIAGEKDATVYADKTAQRIKSLVPHAKIELIKNTGHVIYNAMDKIMPFLSD